MLVGERLGCEETEGQGYDKEQATSHNHGHSSLPLLLQRTSDLAHSLLLPTQSSQYLRLDGAYNRVTASSA